ncbi:hypothetical protein Scep_030481 [Stephania cephalantha]|uniref:Xylanase inhibitor C-terminal domain-containing protein n=1 Tax=Stephania cephalantha TaxID=152367 RepID=A0AAP0DZP0_9MAGN
MLSVRMRERKWPVWRILGANSMVQVRDGVLCLGFVDGGFGRGFDRGLDQGMGGHQLEDNLLQLDLAN